MNFRAVRAIYLFEMARTWRTLLQSIVSPVVSTSLYFVVFGAAIGSRITQVEGVSYGTFIVPGLVMLSVLTRSIANASFGIYFPKFVGTIYELLSAPISYFEIVLGYVGAAATKSIVLGLIILATAGLFVPLHIHHPFWMLTFLVLTAATFSSLELLRNRRRQRRHHAGVPRHLHGHGVVDLQDRLSAEELTRLRVIPGASRASRPGMKAAIYR
jgi:ABC-2 type transport system permease protein